MNDSNAFPPPPPPGFLSICPSFAGTENNRRDPDFEFRTLVSSARVGGKLNRIESGPTRLVGQIGSRQEVCPFVRRDASTPQTAVRRYLHLFLRSGSSAGEGVEIRVLRPR